MVSLKTQFMLDREATREAFYRVKRDFSTISEYLEALKESVNHLNQGILPVKDEMEIIGNKISMFEESYSSMQKDNLESKEALLELGTNINDMATKVNSFKEKIDSLNMEGYVKDTELKGFGALIKENNNKANANARAILNLQKKISVHGKIVKNVQSIAKKSEKGNKKIKNLLNRKVKTLSKKNLELEAAIKGIRKRLVQLNKKIDGK